MGCNFAPGSYPYAEIYELDYSENQVKEAVERFKHKHPEFKTPKVTVGKQGSWDLIDEQSKEPDHWFGIYFYYKNENQILYTWTRPENDKKTTFVFVSVNQGLDLRHWKNINEDFGRSDNKEQKRKFEERILNEIKKN